VKPAAVKVAPYATVGVGRERFSRPRQASAAFRGLDVQSITRCLTARLAASSDTQLRITAEAQPYKADLDATSFALRIRLKFEPLTCGCTPHPEAASMVVNLDVVYGRRTGSLAWFAGVTTERRVAAPAVRARVLGSIFG
jgi:hypothetical protein